MHDVNTDKIIVNPKFRFIPEKIKTHSKHARDKLTANVKTNVTTVRKRWYLWIFPLVAVGISAYLFKQYFYDHGPLIKITFDEASVIQVEKTQLRYRGVTIGTVKNVEISKDHRNIIVSVLLIKGADSFAVEGSQFWMVTPKVSMQGFSGLETIFSGPYIEVVPGESQAAAKTEFKARVEPQSAEAVDNTSSYTLQMNNAESISTGDSITYRGLIVGKVGKLSLNQSGQAIDVQLNVQNRYVRLIRNNTVFWRKLAVQADLGLFGSTIKVNSLDSIMNGGVEFATPEKADAMAKAGTKFVLTAEAPKDAIKWNPVLK